MKHKYNVGDDVIVIHDGNLEKSSFSGVIEGQYGCTDPNCRCGGGRLEYRVITDYGTYTYRESELTQ